jgi:hypothetical protein
MAPDSFQFLVLGEPEPQVATPLAHQINPNNHDLSPAYSVVNPSSALPPCLSTTAASNGEAGLRVPPTWSIFVWIPARYLLPMASFLLSDIDEW